MITPDEIKCIVGQPSKLGPGRDAGEYQMERYQRVAREAVAVFCEKWNREVDQGYELGLVCPKPPCLEHYNCRACWREALREGE